MAILGTVLIVLAGCATTQPARFFVLSPMSGPDEATPVAGGEELSLGIGPIRIPEYLDRTPIVIRTSGNAIDLEEFDRWGEPLADNIARVVGEDLATLLGTNRVAIYPWDRRRAVDYQLEVDILQFDRDPDGTAILRGRWSLKDGKRSVLMTKKSLIRITPEGPDTEALVAALSRCLADFSREVAAAIPVPGDGKRQGGM